MQAFRDAIGKFAIYRSVLRRTYPDYVLFLAVRDVTYNSLFEEPIDQLMIEDENLKLIVFDAEQTDLAIREYRRGPKPKIDDLESFRAFAQPYGHLTQHQRAQQ